ncbi:MAG TPA: sarcosine oxidase subunit alpha family protein [Caulobacteraceae bacterium]|jgi:sarcosine oxidase subunit alpha
MTQSFRSASGGLVERGRTLKFRFAGREYEGYEGDTLASALLANGVRLAGRSFKYHRPRGLIAAGPEESNILVTVGQGGRRTTNLRATEVDLYDGMVAAPVNCWPSLRFDVGAVNNLFSRWLGAGFYYKTFMWPHWMLFEGFIRRAAGLGQPSTEADPDRYELAYAHCDVLVVGGGAAGLAAAKAAAAGGRRVILCDQDTRFGGSLLWCDAEVEGLRGRDWVDRTVAGLSTQPNVRLAPRTTAVGHYDYNSVVLLERVPGREGEARDGARERLWQVRAEQVIYACGALERPIVFPGNDKPGIMLASAARQYANRWGVRTGDRLVVFTNNDSAYDAALAAADAGARLIAVVDSRANVDAQRQKQITACGAELITGGAVIETHGDTVLKGVTVREGAGRTRRIACDGLLMAGGWNPTVHLYSQAGGKLRWEDARAFFRPDGVRDAIACVGACNGTLGLAAALQEGHEAAAFGRAGAPASPQTEEPAIEPLWRVDAPGKAFVDFLNDVTAGDIAQAARENFVSVEHLKRYTTLGMAPDQGKTSNVNALAVMGEATGRAPAQVGTTRYRPPFTPVSMASYRGRLRGDLYRPYRHTPMHAWHLAHGGKIEEFGEWQRPALYLQPGEDHEQAVRRECRAVRTACGLFDASPLGKIEVRGPDAARFVDLIYANTMSTLKPGKLRYGLMLNELGIIIDDGVAARLDEETFLVGTTSGGADKIAAGMEEWLQCEWIDLKVLVAPVTTDWAVINIAGPASPQVLAAVGCDFDPDPKRFEHLSFRTGAVGGIPARVMRVSFTGEASYEINVPADRALDLWERLYAAGKPFGIEPFGIDALMQMRTEKGFLHVGSDTDGTTVPADVGWTKVANRPVDFVGKRSLLWETNQDPSRPQLVGLSEAGGQVLAIGEHVRDPKGDKPTIGYVTSSGYSEALGRGVALAMIQGGRARIGEELVTTRSGQRVRIVEAAAYDPKGERLNG